MGDRLRSRVNVLLVCLIVAGIVGFDRFTKIFFVSSLSVGESIPIIRHVFHFTLVHNTGIAFGLFKNQGMVFVIIPIIAIVLIVFNMYYYRNDSEVTHVYIIAFSLILGGAIGNLTDRILYGHVIDFIDFRIWPVFNIADSAITIGTTILLIKCIPLFAK